MLASALSPPPLPVAVRLAPAAARLAPAAARAVQTPVPPYSPHPYPAPAPHPAGRAPLPMPSYPRYPCGPGVCAVRVPSGGFGAGRGRAVCGWAVPGYTPAVSSFSGWCVCSCWKCRRGSGCTSWVRSCGARPSVARVRPSPRGDLGSAPAPPVAHGPPFASLPLPLLCAHRSAFGDHLLVGPSSPLVPRCVRPLGGLRLRGGGGALAAADLCCRSISVSLQSADSFRELVV